MARKEGRAPGLCKTPGALRPAIRLVEKIRAHPLVADRRLRTTSSSRVFLAIDLVWSVGNLVSGVFSQSFWMITFGVNYALVFVLRLMMLRAIGRRDVSAVSAAPLIAAGAIVCTLVVTVIGVVALAATGEGGSGGSSDVVVITTATYAFWSLGVNIAGAASTRNDGDALFGLKCTGVVRTLFSMLALEITMTLTFEGTSDASERFMLSAMTGVIVGAGLLIVGIILIRRGLRARTATT